MRSALHAPPAISALREVARAITAIRDAAQLGQPEPALAPAAITAALDGAEQHVMRRHRDVALDDLGRRVRNLVAGLEPLGQGLRVDVGSLLVEIATIRRLVAGVAAAEAGRARPAA